MKRISDSVSVEKGAAFYKLVLAPPEISLTTGPHDDESPFRGMKDVKVWLTRAEIRAIAKWVEDHPLDY